MSQLLVIVGTTSQQRDSTADFLCSDPIFSARDKVRAIARNHPANCQIHPLPKPP
jgi:hypothetical protein